MPKDNSKTPRLASPLDKVARMVAGGHIQPAWDISDDSKAIEYQKAVYLQNLVLRTDPKSRLAYQICHYMEADYLDLEGIQDVFPMGRKQHKAARKKADAEKKDIEQQLKETRGESKALRQKLKGKKKGTDPDIEAALDSNDDIVKGLEKELEAVEKNSEYKESYPLKDSTSKRAKGVKLEDWEALKTYLAKKTARPPKGAEQNSIKNAQLLGDYLKFTPAERDLMALMVAFEEDSGFCEFAARIFNGSQKNCHMIVAGMISMTRDKVSEMFRSNSPLVEKGIVVPVTELSSDFDDDDDDMGDPIMPTFSSHLMKVLREPDLTIDSMVRQLIGEPAKAKLDWDKDFAYLGEAGQQIVDLLRGSREQRTRGINILLYGQPGTGKTELIKAACAKAGIELFIIGETSHFGKKPTRKDRLTAATLAQEFLADKPNAAVFLDEMEDLFPASNSQKSLMQLSHDHDDNTGEEPDISGISKVYLNRLLERNQVVTLWAANNPEKFHPAFKRRVMYSLQLHVPPAPVRESIWRSVSARQAFTLSVEDAKALSTQYVVAPGLMDNAVRHAMLTGGGLAVIKGNLRAASNLVFGNTNAISARDELPAFYDSRFLNTAVDFDGYDLQSLAEAIRDSGKRDFSLLLYGPPGTGKSAYLVHLAHMLGMDVLEKDAASLNDKFWGETEKKIAAAFAEAEARGMILLINEADTFLRRRDDLSENYQVAVVNTMLTQAEHHPLPFCCTTNLFDNIDPAAKRRFLFKIEFGHLRPEQARDAYTHFFGRPAPNDLSAMCPKLAPSDFVTASKQLPFLRGEATDARIVNLLAKEAKARLDVVSAYSGSANGAGFTAKGRSFG